MKNNKFKAEPVQGAEPAKEEEVNLEQVRKWLKKDLAMAISCLNAVYTDPDLIESVAVFMMGRMTNDKNAKAANEALKNQTKLDI